MRYTKNQKEPDFTDQELLTTYPFSVAFERRFRIKEIYEYILHHWLDYFPTLPSYTAYNARVVFGDKAFCSKDSSRSKYLLFNFKPVLNLIDGACPQLD